MGVPWRESRTGRSHQDALARELQEEIGITVLQSSPLLQIYHESPDYSVMLHVYLIEHFEGEALGLEGQKIQWVLPEELHQYEFPPASPKILEVVKKMATTPVNLEVTEGI